MHDMDLLLITYSYLVLMVQFHMFEFHKQVHNL